MAKSYSPAVGNHLFVAFDGTDVGGDTTAEDLKPSGDYPRLGFCDQLVKNPQFLGETVKKRASPGGYKRVRTRYREARLTLSAQLQDITEDTAVLTMLGHGTLNASTKVFEPLSQAAPALGWVRVQQYTEDDDHIETSELWCEVRAGQSTYSENPTVIPVTFEVLENDLNVGLLANLAGAPT